MSTTATMRTAVPETPKSNFRIPREVLAALDKAAADDGRNRTNMLLRILKDWLTAHGYLK